MHSADETVEGVPAPVGPDPVQFTEAVDGGFGPRPRGGRVERRFVAARFAATDVFRRVGSVMCWLAGARGKTVAPRRSRFDGQRQRQVRAVGQRRHEVAVDVAGGGVGPDHHRPVVDVVAGP